MAAQDLAKKLALPLLGGAAVGGGAVAMLGNWGSGGTRQPSDPDEAGYQAQAAGMNAIRQGSMTGVPPAGVDPEEYNKVMAQMKSKMERAKVELAIMQQQLGAGQPAPQQPRG